MIRRFCKASAHEKDMRRFIINLEKDYLAFVFLAVGILLVAFPEQFSKISPYVLGIALILQGIAVVILAFRFKDPFQGPGKAVIYFVMGLTIMMLGSGALGIIGVIWAVFALIEVSKEIDRMWKEKKFSAVCLISSVISIGLAALLMTDPFKHFVVHVRILGLEIITSCIARRADSIRNSAEDASYP